MKTNTKLAELSDKLRIMQKFGWMNFHDLFEVSEETKLEAIQRNVNAIKLMINPSKELQMTAVTKDVFAVLMINEPHREVRKFINDMAKNAREQVLNIDPTAKVFKIHNGCGYNGTCSLQTNVWQDTRALTWIKMWDKLQETLMKRMIS